MNWIKTRRSHFLALAVVLSLSAVMANDAHGGTVPQLVIIEPDNYAEDQVLDHVSPHVTLSTGAFSDYRPTFSVTARDDPAGASTGTKVFTAGGVRFWNSGRALRMDFHANVTDIRLDYIASGFFDNLYTCKLEAYSSTGALLATDFTAPLAGGGVGTMSVSAPHIKYALAYPPDDPFGDLDALSFTVPEPTTLVGACFVLGAIALRRSNRRSVG